MKGLLMALALNGLIGFAGCSSEPRVICCGECKPGDDCLKKCKVEGKVPEGTKLTCCGKCQKGDDCLKKCGARSCCK